MTPQEIIAQVTDLPPVPQAGLKLMRLLENPDGNADDVVKVVQTDAVLSAKLLRICNSASFGFRAPVESVQQAVFALGFAEIQRLAIALSFGSTMNRPLDGYAIEGEDYWLHSLLVALGAESLASSIPKFRGSSSAAYTAGLLHDIGKLVLNRALPPATMYAIRDLIETGGCSRVTAEAEVTGTDHAEVGATLLQQWKLPASLVEAVRHHHRPVCEPGPTLSVFVHMANCIAHQFGSAPGWGSCAMQADHAAMAAAGFDAESYQSAMMTVLDQIDKARQFTVAA